MDYSSQLSHPKWQRKRLKVLERDNFTCTMCGDTETTLHVHHLEYKGCAWDVEFDMLTTLCSHCHLIIEEFKKINKTVKRIIKLTSEKIVDFIILMAVVDSQGENFDLYYFFEYSLTDNELSYKYMFNSTFFNELKSKIDG